MDAIHIELERQGVKEMTGAQMSTSPLGVHRRLPTRTCLTATVSALIVAAVAAGAGAAAAAATPRESFRVCSPLGCALQVVTGVVDVGSSLTRVTVRATDQASGSALSVRLELAEDGRISRQQFTVDDGTRSVSMTHRGTPDLLRVSACAVPPGSCNTHTIPLK